MADDVMLGRDGINNFYEDVLPKLPPYSTAVEIGTWTGRSAIAAGMIIRDNPLLVSFYTIDHCHGSDPVMAEIVKSSYNGNLAGEIVNNLYKYDVSDFVTLIVADSGNAARLFQAESIDVLFIDGGHTYEEVMRDLDVWYPKIRQNGIIGGHDLAAHSPGVAAALSDFFHTCDLAWPGAEWCWGIHKP